MNRRAVRRPVLTLAVAVALLAAVADLLSGQAFGLSGVLHALVHPESIERTILLELRVPRVVTALVAGFALGLSGFVLQSVLANPLATPELVGVNQGAVVGVLIAVGSGVVTAGGATGSLAAALVGGLLAGSVSFVAASVLPRAGLIIVGVVTAAVLGGVSVLALSLRASAFGEALRWLVGSVSGQTWSVIAVAGAWTAAWSLALVLASPIITALATGDDFAGGIGLRVRPARLAVLVGVVCVVAGAAALAGAITFVGLMAGHLARGLTASVGVRAILTAACVGAALLCGCDALAQLATAILTSNESRAGVPAGAVAAIVGAAALIAVVRRQEATW